MIFLDDYEIQYKTEGMRIVDVILKNVPPDLLRRTGVTDLLFTVSHSLHAQSPSRSFKLIDD